MLRELLTHLQAEWEKNADLFEQAQSNLSMLVEIVRLSCDTLFKKNNVSDITLLHSQASELVVKYGGMIEAIVFKKNSFLPEAERVDLIANVRTRLLEKMADGKLAEQYKGDSLFSTYFYQVVYFAMIDELRLRQSEGQTDSLEDSWTSLEDVRYAVHPAEGIAYRDAMEQHLQNLAGLLKMLPEKKQKRFVLCLKVFYGMKLAVEDVREPFPDCDDDLLVEVLSDFGKNYHDLSKAEVFDLVSGLMYELEGGNGKVIKADSLRVWFQMTLKKIRGVLFAKLQDRAKSDLDAYFELLVYKLFEKA